jgi:proteasome lid subunit RPN8/RPN11
MAATIEVCISPDLLRTIFATAKNLYPRETILLLRGKKNRDLLTISELIVPPLANYGRGFANIPLHMLPIDFSIVGTAHSHPSGNLAQSYMDLNHFFGRILMIVGFPFKDESNIMVYNRGGDKLKLNVARS